MRRIAVLTYFDGTQGLKTLNEIMNIGKEFKTQGRKTKALSQWCTNHSVERIDIFTTDGKHEDWLIKCEKKQLGTVRMEDLLLEIAEILEKDLQEYLEGMKK